MSEGELPLDRIYDLLADAERRELLRALDGIDGCVPLATLVEDVCEALDEPAAAAAGDRRVRFHHVQLPKLEEAGVVAYNPDLHLVRPADRFDAVTEHLVPIARDDETGPLTADD